MTRFVLTTDLKDDAAAIEAYREHHRAVWPEVLDSLHRAGIGKMDIYLLGRRAVMVVETDGRDLARCFAQHVASGPRVAEWERLMRALQQAPPGARGDEWWSLMEPVFSLEDALARPSRS
jgi:L-rhamnose mutarotase